MSISKKNITASELSALAQSDRLQLLYRQSSPAIYVSIFNAALLATILWSAQEHSVLLTWFSVLLITAMARLYLFSRYHKLAPQGQDVLCWETPYFITLIMSSIVWGVGCVLIMPPDSPVHQAVIF